MPKRYEPQSSLAEERVAFDQGAAAYRRDPAGDPRGPYDGRTRLGRAWGEGWRAAQQEAEAALKRGKEASDGS